MTVRLCLVSWGHMNTVGAAAWAIRDAGGYQIGQSYATREEAEAALLAPGR